MRHSPVFIFFAGFAVGLVFLSALLWQTGNLHATSRLLPPQPQPVAITPATTNASSPPRDSFSPRPLIPVRGVTASDLRDNFNDIRAGHRHEALDIMAPRGTPVLAAVEGTVVKLFLSKPGGLTVYQFDRSRTYCYYYAHLDRYAAGLTEGNLLHRGEVLGYVGSTGNASPDAPHLHFAIFQLGPEKRWWEGNIPLDPYSFLAK